MVVAESSIPVSSLVQEFNQIGKSKFENEKSLIIECEIEIKGIVKKVVKVKSLFDLLLLFDPLLCSKKFSAKKYFDPKFCH